MKRTAMPQRRTPMRRTSIDRTAMPAHDRHTVRKPTRHRKSDIPPRVRRQVRSRSGGDCEARVERVCAGRARHMHHVVLRSRGGKHTARNLLDLCLPCHDHIHAHPIWATEHGFMARKNTRGSTT